MYHAQRREKIRLSSLTADNASPSVTWGYGSFRPPRPTNDERTNGLRATTAVTNQRQVCHDGFSCRPGCRSVRSRSASALVANRSPARVPSSDSMRVLQPLPSSGSLVSWKELDCQVIHRHQLCLIILNLVFSASQLRYELRCRN